MRISTIINHAGMYKDGVKIEMTPENIKAYEDYRFWCRVSIKAQKDLCWEWQGCKTKAGYGRHTIRGKQVLASRYSYLWHYKKDAGDLFVCHKCDNPSCCNPHHLFLGTAKDNQQDMVSKGRKRVQYGADNGFSKIKEEDVVEIKRLRAEGLYPSQIAKLFPIGKTQVYRICVGGRWGHLK